MSNLMAIFEAENEARMVALESRITAMEAALTSTNQTVASADANLATQLAGVQATVTNHEGRLQTLESATSTTPPSESPDGFVVPDDGSQAVDATLAIWTISSGVVQRNSVNAGTTSGVTQLLYLGGSIYIEDATNWSKWNGTGWDVIAGDPRVTTPVESANGTTIPSAAQIVDQTLSIWTLVNGVVYKGGAAFGYSANVIQVLYWNKRIYQQHSTGWYWTDGTSSWSGPVSDPRVSGGYTVQGTKFYKPDGTVFRPRGFCLLPFNTGLSTYVVTHWGANFIRLAWDPLYYSQAQVQTVFEEYADLGIPVVVEWHQIGGYANATTVSNNFLALYNVYKGTAREKYLWFQPQEEPGGSGDIQLVNGAYQFNPTVMSTWISMVRTVAQNLRNAGCTSPIGMPAPVWAQDILINTTTYARQWQSGFPACSALLTYADQLRAGFSDVYFCISNYDQYSEGGLSTGQAHMSGFLTQAAAQNMAIVFGETGSTNNNYSTLTATQAMFNLEGSFDFGWAWWDFKAADANNLTTTGDGGGDLINSTTNPTNLSPGGQLVWNALHA